MSAAVRTVALIVYCALASQATAYAQAEPAPPGYVPPGHHEPELPPPSPLKWHVAADARIPIPIREPQSLPSVGWGAGAQITRALIDLGRIRFGVGADFGYSRISSSGSVATPDFSHHLGEMTFAGLLVFDAIVGAVRPWLAGGAGIAVAWYFQPNPNPMQPPTDVQTVVPVVMLDLGISYAVYHGIDVGVAAHLDLTFSSLSVGTPPFTVFDGGIFAPRIQLGFRF